MLIQFTKVYRHIFLLHYSSVARNNAQIQFIVHKVLTLTAKKRDQRDYKNSDKNRLLEIKVKLEAN